MANQLRIIGGGAPAPEADGRRRRAQDSRARIVAAMLELVHAGEASPAAEDVAARAKVGLRTVFRHFRDMDSLYREMTEVIEGELHAIIDEPLVGAGWRARLDEILERRAAVYERIAPFKRAADVHRRESASLQASHARMVAISREILHRELPPEIARDRTRMEAVDLLLSFEAWSRLRDEQGLSARRAAEVVRSLLDALLR